LTTATTTSTARRRRSNTCCDITLYHYENPHRARTHDHSRHLGIFHPFFACGSPGWHFLFFRDTRHNIVSQNPLPVHPHFSGFNSIGQHGFTPRISYGATLSTLQSHGILDALFQQFIGRHPVDFAETANVLPGHDILPPGTLFLSIERFEHPFHDAMTIAMHLDRSVSHSSPHMSTYYYYH